MNINKIMKQAQEMQKKMEAMQEELAKKEFEGNSGGGMVKVTLNGKNEMRKIAIDSSLFDPDEKDMLEDLIIAAFNDAKNKVDEESGDLMSGAMGGLNMPPGFKMPF